MRRVCGSGAGRTSRCGKVVVGVRRERSGARGRAVMLKVQNSGGAASLATLRETEKAAVRLGSRQVTLSRARRR